MKIAHDLVFQIPTELLCSMTFAMWNIPHWANRQQWKRLRYFHAVNEAPQCICLYAIAHNSFQLSPVPWINSAVSNVSTRRAKKVARPKLTSRQTHDFCLVEPCIAKITLALCICYVWVNTRVTIYRLSSQQSGTRTIMAPRNKFSGLPKRQSPLWTCRHLSLKCCCFFHSLHDPIFSSF